MKIPMLLLVPYLLFLTGCASAPAPQASAQAEVPPTAARYDTEWMQRYESAARRGGVKVYWVNLPRRHQQD